MKRTLLIAVLLICAGAGTATYIGTRPVWLIDSMIPSLRIVLDKVGVFTAESRARVALRRGDLRLIAIWRHWSYDLPGVLCNDVPFDDGIGPPEQYREILLPDAVQWVSGHRIKYGDINDYAVAYNQTVVQSQYYPDRDICGLRPPDVYQPIDWEVPAPLQRITAPRPSDYSSLQVAARFGNLEHVRRWLDDGTDIDERDRWYKTALTWAVERGHLDVVRLLIERGANTEIRDWSGVTALGRAAEQGHLGIVRYLIRHDAVIEPTERNGSDTPLMAAEKKGHTEIVDFLIRHGARNE